MLASGSVDQRFPRSRGAKNGQSSSEFDESPSPCALPVRRAARPPQGRAPDLYVAGDTLSPDFNTPVEVAVGTTVGSITVHSAQMPTRKQRVLGKPIEFFERYAGLS